MPVERALLLGSRERSSAPRPRRRRVAYGRPVFERRQGRSIVDRRLSGVDELLCARLLDAAGVVIGEQGYDAATVAAICSRARVARRAFYEVFTDREDCAVQILAASELGLESEILAASGEASEGCERLRTGLWMILCAFERNPALARTLLSESARGGERLIAERRRIRARLIETIDRLAREDSESETEPVGSFAAEATLGGVVAILASRVEAGKKPRLRGLLGELMSVLLLPYQGAAIARKQLQQPLPPGPQSHRERPRSAAPVSSPVRLTYRTIRVLQAASQLEGAASNRQIADHAGITDAGQASKILARLQKHRLITNGNARKEAKGKGDANRWTLTSVGQRLTATLPPRAAARGAGMVRVSSRPVSKPRDGRLARSRPEASYERQGEG